MYARVRELLTPEERLQYLIQFQAEYVLRPFLYGKMIIKMEEAARLTIQGIKGVIESAAIIADDVKNLIGSDDVIQKQAPIRLELELLYHVRTNIVNELTLPFPLDYYH